jgi:hypothetical protein
MARYLQSLAKELLHLLPLYGWIAVISSLAFLFVYEAIAVTSFLLFSSYTWHQVAMGAFIISVLLFASAMGGSHPSSHAGVMAALGPRPLRGPPSRLDALRAIAGFVGLFIGIGSAIVLLVINWNKLTARAVEMLMLYWEKVSHFIFTNLLSNLQLIAGIIALVSLIIAVWVIVAKSRRH